MMVRMRMLVTRVLLALGLIIFITRAVLTDSIALLIWVFGGLIVASIIALAIWALLSEWSSRISLPWVDDITTVMSLAKDAPSPRADLSARYDWERMVGTLK